VVLSVACPIVLAALVLLRPACAFGPLPQSGCEGIDRAFQGYLSPGKCPIPAIPTFQSYALAGVPLDIRGSNVQRLYPVAVADAAPGASEEREEQGFHWRRALTESFTFLLIEQSSGLSANAAIALIEGF
jgi:hypothetical protein